MIVKDETDSLMKCLDSIKHYVDEINLVLTDKTALKTREIAQQYTNKIYDFEWNDSFADARNYSFEKSTKDIILWLDADDIVLNGDKLHYIVDTAFSNKDIGVIFLPYNYEYDDNGLVVTKHDRERIVRKGVFKWVGGVHETLIPLKPFAILKNKDIIVKHNGKRQFSKEKHERNLRILEKEIKLSNEPLDPRLIYHYATTLKGLSRDEEALEWFERYVKVSGWDEEIYIAYHRICQIYQGRKDYDKAISTSLTALTIKPTYKEAYFDLAKSYYWIGNLDKCIHWIEQGLRLPLPDTVIIINPREYDYNPLLMLSDCLFRKGRAKEALACYKKIKQFNQNDENVDYSMNLVQQFIRTEEAGKSLVDAVEFCLQNEEIGKAEKIINNAPIELRDLPLVQKKRMRIRFIMDRIRGYDNGERNLSISMNANTVPELDKEQKYQMLLAGLKARKEIKNILDVGCFNGWMANALAKEGYSVTGTDIGKEALEIAKKNSEGLTNPSKFEFCNYRNVGADYYKKFDAITCFDVMEHVLNPVELIRNLELACKDNGWIFIHVPNGAWHKGNMDTDIEDLWEHYQSFEYRDLVNLFIGRRNLHIYKLNHDCVESPGQSSLFVVYQNAFNSGRKIEFVCFNTPEPFYPDKIKEGIGGSEEAIINITKEFDKMGYRVIVYNNCEGNIGIHENVAYVPENEFDIFGEHDIVIAWRNPFVFKLPINANLKILWLHDVPDEKHYDEELLDNIDKIFVLSKWHRECMPNIPDEKFYVTRNGVDINLFERYTNIERNPYKVVYGSSPDRGLDKLLEIWGDVKKEVPQAELHVYYGWVVYDALRTEPHQIAWKKKVMDMMKQNGVIDHGRIGHEELAKEYSSAGIWSYFTYFYEISCITAIKTQLAGCIPVCTDLGALPETVKNGVIISADVNTSEGLNKCKEILIDTLKNQAKWNRELIKQAVKTYYKWSVIAQEWQKDIFNGTKRTNKTFKNYN
jgi:2-polyprenyl-3-methyl-5-hydroxy-6-metoxy-1,4-benzoquinol methylase/glycosyltransferase involved in cell wall biosynthesis